LLALRPEIQKADTLYYKGEGEWYDTNNQPVEGLEGWTDFDTLYRPAFTRGYYLFNAQDSIGRAYPGDNKVAVDKDGYPTNDYVGRFDYGAEYTTRLAFVDGVHMGDTFYVLRNKFKNIDTKRIKKEDLWYKIPVGDKLYLGENTHYKPRWTSAKTTTGAFATNGIYNDAYNGKSVVFQFRLIDPQKDVRRSFLIETEQFDGIEIGPQKAKWVKIQNGVPVVSDSINWISATQNGAEIFNVIAGDVDKAVSNEAAPVVGAAKVIGEVGAVTIQNAAGKKVAISNILGQTVANAVLTSDNASISLPKGIVVVAIEGEPAVKAVVK
jgi:hypothetical protein